MELDSDSSFSDEENFETDPIQCLFCKIFSQSIDLAIKHLKTDHNFDLSEMKKKFKIDQYLYIKMINYIRTHESKPTDFLESEKVFWSDEKYLKPVKYEPWLTYDFEDIEIPSFYQVNEGEEDKEFEIKRLRESIAEKDDLLKQAYETIKQLRSGFRRIVDKDDDESSDVKNKSVANISIGADEAYFSSYAHFSIHHEMLSDTVRTSSYRDAILKNKDYFQGKTVLDVGCGTSILSMFASSAGAKRVVAIDNSEIIYQAMDIARINNFTNIDFVKGRLEDTPLPIEKFDIIISEWMGFFLIFEGMLDTIIYAREHHLQPPIDEGGGGIIMPNRCTLSIVGYGDEKRYKDYIEFWDSVYGFNMSTMKREVLRDPMVEICNPEFVLTDSNVICNYDLNTVTLNYSTFSYDFNMKCTKDGTLSAIVAYFDTFFDLLPEHVSFSTSPYDKSTHWKQVIFFIGQPTKLQKGEILKGTIECSRNVKDMRTLNIVIRLNGRQYLYKM